MKSFFMSYIHLITKYSTELNLISNGTYKYNDKFELVKIDDPKKINDPKEIPKNKILNHIFDSFKTAPVYYLAAKTVANFFQIIDKYCDKSSSATVKKIKQLVEGKASKIWSGFQTDSAKKINVILDKRNIDEKEYFLLYDLANYFAFHRLTSQIFYQEVAINEKIKKLREDYPNISIEIDQGGKWSYLIIYSSAQNAAELQFILFLDFHNRNHPDLEKYDPIFLKKIIQKKIESDNEEFKKELESTLMAYVISALCKQWDQYQHCKKLIELDTLIVNSKTEFDELNKFSSDFIQEPESYHDLKENKINFTPFTDNIDLKTISKELFEVSNETNDSFDIWYKAIYKKIEKYKELHPEVIIPLPLIIPEEFTDYKNFFSIKNLKIPLLDQIIQWEKEAKKLNEQKKMTPNVKAKPKQTSKEVEYSKLEVSKTEELSTPSQNSIEKSIEILPETKPQLISEQIIIEKEKSMVEFLEENSPFKVKKRVTDWFISPDKLEILNEESPLFHNFAWAVNNIL